MTNDGDPTSSARMRGLVVEAVDASAEFMARPSVVALWNAPSALDDMTVGALCAHLVRAAGATIAYLDRTDPATRPDGALLTPVTYFHAAIDSPIHEQIKDVSAGRIRDWARCNDGEVLYALARSERSSGPAVFPVF